MNLPVSASGSMRGWSIVTWVIGGSSARKALIRETSGSGVWVSQRLKT